MDFALTKEEAAIFEEVRQFIKDEITPELLQESRHLELIYGGPAGRKFIQKLAKRGWLTPEWPKEYGGIGAREALSYMIMDELMYNELPTHFTAAKMAGPCIMRVASEEMKKRFLLPIARGEIEMALGYTEPEAGSDLMSLKTKGEDKGDHFLVNGQKIFSTSCHVAEYHWLACKTEPDKKGASAISLFIVDLKSPGITIRPLITRVGTRTNEVFYEDVKVPKENLVGERGKGAYYIMQALDFERMWPFGAYRRIFDDLVEYTKEKIVDSLPLSKNPIVRQKLAKMAGDLEAGKMLYYRISHLLDMGKVPANEASMQKVFTTENCEQKLVESAMQILGHYGPLEEGSKWAQLEAKVAYWYQWSYVETLVGGTSEIMRNILATRGLGLPRG